MCLHIKNSMEAFISLITYLVKIHLVVHEILSVSYFSYFSYDKWQPFWMIDLQKIE